MTCVTPTLPEAMEQAVAAYARGRLGEADDLARAILDVDADYFDALHLIAVISTRQRRLDEALASYDRALAVQPDHAEVLCNRGTTLHELRRFDEALASYDRALAGQPNHAVVLCNRGVTLYELRRFDDALASYDRALALRPDYAGALYNRGIALYQLDRFDEALASYDRALAVRPNYAEALRNRGNTLHELQRFNEALASYNRALALRPDHAGAHVNKSVLQLLNGDFAAGWREYEWRWKRTRSDRNLRLLKRDFAQPLWLGQTAIAGKTILLHSEQGFGDTIQFCRYAPLVAGCGARVLLEVPAPLKDLMASLAGVAEVVAAPAKLPDFDLHCPLLSLPLAFGTSLDTIPARTPYLFAAAAKTSAWRARLGAREKPRVGLVWAGEPGKRIDRMRSLEFDQLAPILRITGCEFYSLQKGEHALAQLRNSALRQRVVDCADDLHDFSDTAALIDNLDLIIAVDTSVAHLAGALGKPFWLLNRYNTCWRWLIDRDDSPWYPTARLFRQNAPGDWSGVISRVVVELEKLLQLYDERAPV
jgi:tetratricopeptide (TPR) repeat protein